MKNILDDIPKELDDELLTQILSSKKIKIERIVSRGHRSPDNFWYDQSTNEFVLVIKGHAIVVFEDENIPVELKTGDYLNIPANKRHRVEWTDPNQETIWLAVFYQ